ncbi:MAG TPA: prepilin-type N-terminal cleavage/methylation domain-containing protein, partial [Candidatus Ozemobacteraceae bacterium]|nr:prepilin-type N-terminal cleavage/methylation domain-containing protein [Candidatus Ozemobacteraceae bacterium]
MRTRRAFTLIEIAIGVLIGSIVILAATKLLSGGLRSSTKGSSHLSIIQATSILMCQLDEDLKRTVVIDFPALNAKDPTARLEILERTPSGILATSTITYQAGPSGTGIVRRRDPTGGTASEHEFCRGFPVVP